MILFLVLLGRKQTTTGWFCRGHSQSYAPIRPFGFHTCHSLLSDIQEAGYKSRMMTGGIEPSIEPSTSTVVLSTTYILNSK